MKHFLPLILTLATGCSTQFNPAQPHLAQKDRVTTPKVVFMGDSITHNWPASGVLKQHPMWIDKSSTTLETSASMTARFQTDVLDLKPDVVHILCCQGDMDSADCVSSPYADVNDMQRMASAAGIKVVIGSNHAVGRWAAGDAN